MPVSIRLGPELEERLARASRKLRVNKTEVIKRSLEAYLAQVEPGRTPSSSVRTCSAPMPAGGPICPSE